MSRDTGLPAGLSTLLEQWVDEGLLSSEQAEQIVRREQRRGGAAEPVAGPRVSLVIEALGYVGGALITVGAVLIAGQLWGDLSSPVRVVLPASAATLLLAAGLAVPDHLGPIGTRLRAVLLALSVVALAGLLALVGTELLKWETGENVALLVAAGSAFYAGALWTSRPSVLQQAVFFVALLVTAATATARFGPEGEALPGLALWSVALAWLGLAWGGWLQPRRAAYTLGSGGAVFGALSMMSVGWGQVLALVTTLALVAVAVAVGDLVVLGIGAVGTLLVLPGTVVYFFPGAFSAPVALLAAGVLLLAAALRTARRREKQEKPAERV